MSIVSLNGLTKPEALAALFNYAKPQGLGMLHYKPDHRMDSLEAGIVLTQGMCVDYLEGRVIKVDFGRGGDTIDTRLYDIDNRILRKGSISLQKDETAIIPMNMRDGSIIVRGKGNPEWNFSGPHGAGRLMSRSKAKESLSVEEFRQSMDGIFTTCVGKSTIDESPMAYKPMDEIIRNIQDTAEVVKIIKPVYNFKAAE